MSTNDPRRAAAAAPALTALPQVQDLPVADHGYDRTKVEDAFESFRRHVTSLQAQLRVLQAAPRGGSSEPTGHAVRMDALHLVRAAAEFADTIERDAAEAAAKQVGRAEQEIRERNVSLGEQEAEVQRIRQETERQRLEVVNAARNEARDLLAKANQDSAQTLRESEASGARLLEQSRHQASELTNAARAEVEQTLEWARAQAATIIARAQQGTEQLLGAAGLGEAAATEVAEAIVKSAEQAANASRAGEPEPRAPAGGEVSPTSQPLRSAPAPATAPGQPQPSEATPPASPPPEPEQPRQPPSDSGDTNS